MSAVPEHPMAKPTEHAHDGHIVTFYSFTGGTGRTVALANVAWILAANGKRVLAVDWDLESPGLHHWFRPFLIDKTLSHSRGVIDIIRNFARATFRPDRGPQNTSWYVRYADVEREAVSLTWQFVGDGVIDLLPAGQQDPSYPVTVSTFDWEAFHSRLNGRAFLNAMRNDMRRRYDYILINSRSGLSDTAAICTVNLPDTVVDCFALNDQSIDDAAAVAQSIISLRKREPVRLLPLPLRTEETEQSKLEDRRSHARERFVQDLQAEIPFKPVDEEALAIIGTTRDDEPIAAYEKLTAAITDGAITQLPTVARDQYLQWLADNDSA
jgi:MinD-like ATPase involved in chromosome partitioning or flagellar assembly